MGRTPAERPALEQAVIDSFSSTEIAEFAATLRAINFPIPEFTWQMIHEAVQLAKLSDKKVTLSIVVSELIARGLESDPDIEHINSMAVSAIEQAYEAKVSRKAVIESRESST